MTKQDRHILFMVVLTLALIVAAGVRVLFGAVDAAGDEASPSLYPTLTSPYKGEEVGIGVAAGVPKDVLGEIRNWPKGLSAKEMAIFSEGLLALILRPVRSLDMASLISPLSQAGVLLARLWRTARAQVWGWIQSVKKSLTQLPSRILTFTPTFILPRQGGGDVGWSSLHKFCILRL